jgi:hypothetical protein
MLPAFRIFISCVSAEFRGYRDQLRGCLTSPGNEIKVQEECRDGGGTLLEKLDDYINSCQAMIHLVGDGCGCAPQPAEVRNLLGRYPDLPTALPELAAAFQPDRCPFTYTQWEAFLAIYHRVECFIYLAATGTQREPGWTASPSDSASQEAHRARLRELGQDRRMVPFDDARDVALRFLNSITLPTQIEPDESTASRPAISWPAPPPRFEYPLADREAEFDTFVRLITGQTPERIYLISGPSDRGKSVLVEQFAELALRLGVRCAHEEFKSGLPLPEVLWDLAHDLAPLRFPRFERERQRDATDALRTAFLQDLDETRVPILLVLDTYEQATEEAKQWVEDSLLPHFRRHDGLRLVLAGKIVPEAEGHVWARLAIRRELPPIREVAPWHDYSRRVLGLAHPDNDIRLLVEAAQGSPRVLGSLLGNLKAARA